MDAYQNEEFVFTGLIPEVQTNLSGEKIPGISQIGDEALEIPEGEPFPEAGVVEDWIYTPETKKAGLKVSVTREAIFFDRTGQLLDRCSAVGYALGLNVEKKAIDCVVDENRTTHRYNWRAFGQIATYGDNSGNHSWDNLAASNGLTDWKNLDVAEQLFNGLLDPLTGEPVVIEPKDFIFTKQNEQTARRILSATEIRVATPGYATSGSPTLTNAMNPYSNKYRPVTSRLLAARLATDTDWFLADVAKLAKRMINFPLQTKEAPANSHEEFQRDVVKQYRADERSSFVVVEPRAAVRSTA